MTLLNTIKNLPAAAANGLTAADAIELEQDASRSLTLGILLGFIAANLQVTADNGGTTTALKTLLQALDPTSQGFQAAFDALFKAYVAGLPKDQGTGVAPVPAGEVFSNNGTPQLAQ